jgi:hypothetical protein
VSPRHVLEQMQHEMWTPFDDPAAGDLHRRLDLPRVASAQRHRR